MRKRAKIDANHREVVEALRKIGASVQSLSAVGNGCPDLLVGIGGHNILLEVKDGTKPPSKRTLTEDQIRWGALWRGTRHVVESAREAIELVNLVNY